MPPVSNIDQKYHQIDHLVYVVPSLPMGMKLIKEKTGVEPVYGGRHPGMGTHNAILSLGNKTYLEVIAPDPKQDIAGPLWFGIDKIIEPLLVTWAIRVNRLERTVERMTSIDLVPGPIQEASRRLENGGIISWRLTDPRPLLMDGVVPFLIDWGTSPHPTDDKDSEVQLLELKVYHPEQERANQAMKVLGLDVEVVSADAPRIELVLNTPQGKINL